MKCFIAYDLGTGGLKTGIYTEEGNSLGFRFKPYDTHFPSPDFREQRPVDWWEAVVSTTKELVMALDINIDDIVSLAVSGHSLGAIPITQEGELLCEFVPVWNDARAKKIAKSFFEKTSEEEWYLSTGNGFPPELYSIFKILWYKENMPKVYEKTYKFIGTKDYINYKMTGVIATDRSYASGSGVYSLKNGGYNEKYIKLSGIDENKLPKILESTEVLGNITKSAARELGLSEGTLVCAGGVDNACMALGAGCIFDGEVYTGLGTSAWIAECDSTPALDTVKRPYVFAHCIPEKFVSSTAIFSAGNSLRWVRDKLFYDLCKEEESGGESAYKVIDTLASKSPIGANRLFFIPTLAGGSSLDSSPNARGLFVGLDLMHEREDIARATLEGIALNLRSALDVLRSHVEIGNEMLIVGGGSKSKIWMQIFSDVYGMDIMASDFGEDAGSFGAAAVAAVGAGLWESFDKVKDIIKNTHKASPKKENVLDYSYIMPVFEKLIYASSELGDVIKL